MSDIRELWLRSHGYKPDDIAWYARDLDWLLTDQRFKAPDFRPPKEVGAFFGLARMMEAEVIRLIADGCSVAEMAAQLDLASSTIKTHVQTLYEKLGVSDRGSAVAVAMRLGMRLEGYADISGIHVLTYGLNRRPTSSE